MERKIIIVFSLILLFASGCSVSEFNRAIFHKRIDTIETFINQSNWTEAENEVEELKRIYTDDLWKLQVLGDDREYTVLKMEINKLLTAIDASDKQAAKMQIAIIEGYLNQVSLDDLP